MRSKPLNPATASYSKAEPSPSSTLHRALELVLPGLVLTGLRLQAEGPTIATSLVSAAPPLGGGADPLSMTTASTTAALPPQPTLLETPLLVQSTIPRATLARGVAMRRGTEALLVDLSTPLPQETAAITPPPPGIAATRLPPAGGINVDLTLSCLCKERKAVHK